MHTVSIWALPFIYGGTVANRQFIPRVPYIPVYKSIPCISQPPILEPKNRFFLFVGENFLEKLILYLRTLFQARYSYMKKITASLDVKFIITRMRVLKRVLATQV